MPAVISDTSCLIFLLRLLPDLFGQVWLTPAVAAEYRLALPAWAVVEAAAWPSPT